MQTASLTLSPTVARTVPDPPVPWWRVGVMWLVVGGLGTVVIASFALLATAIREADTVLPHGAVRGTPAAPAMQGRNHAATPVPPTTPAPR